MKEICVQTETKTYPVLVGRKASTHLHDILQRIPNKPSKLLIVTDDCVERLYLPSIVSQLSDAYTVHTFVLKHGEDAKSFENFYAIQTVALEKGLDRHSAILALGGGVVGDIAGFVASTFMRGISFIQLPTTLLAHDSAVGGKVAINHPLGKNMIGSFYQPEAVVYDVNFLQSLPKEELRSGFAEVIKHSLIWDAAFYKWLRHEVFTMDDLTPERLLVCLENGIKIKAEVVAQDEKEQGLRAILNFGHTLGHALEASYGYGKISHGDGVALGMLFATKLSERLNPELVLSEEMSAYWKMLGFPTSIKSDLTPSQILEWMKKDKKTKDGHIHMVLMEKVGHVKVKKVQDDLILDVLSECY
ncbi:3-dehydroquinate synthase [Bacillus sp. THAF10]|uniref:3-dehydroquinate synthase n=1 Tax=Bacillus sp. THAF10 TaxID=2587848 RepID=UPI001268CDC8|nr:3-dehydroquinate synthase [Bacillus sp. THAF10]